MSRFQTAEAQARLPELICRAMEGEEIVVANEDGTAVRLEPLEPRGRPRFGSAAGLFTMAEDFDSPLDDLDPYER